MERSLRCLLCNHKYFLSIHIRRSHVAVAGPIFHLHFSSVFKIGRTQAPGGVCPKSLFPLLKEAGKRRLEMALLGARRAGPTQAVGPLSPRGGGQPKEPGQRRACWAVPSFLPPEEQGSLISDRVPEPCLTAHLYIFFSSFPLPR